MEDYKIKLKMFEGPFDLLLHLIDKNEVDIYDIPIAEITAQYLDYIEQMQELDLDVAAEFLVMAATLLSIKAKMLLPKLPAEPEDSEEEPDPRTQLVRDLLEYKKIKEAAVNLEKHYLERQKLHKRENDISLYSNMFSEVNPLDGKTLDDLASAFYGIWQKLKDEKTTVSIKKNVISIGGMMDKIYSKVCEYPNGILFEDIMTEFKITDKIHFIVAFIALLELIKNNIIKFQQDDIFGKIVIFAKNINEYQLQSEGLQTSENQ